MDPFRFDALSRSLATDGSRRGVLGLLAAAPVVGGLLGIFTPKETEARGRRKRRKTRNERRSGDDKKNRKGQHKKKPQCTPESAGETCANTCGSVTNNCQQPVDCGSCACASPCDVCFTCQDGPNTPGTCVVDATQVGEACGSAGQICQLDGTCACDATSCPNCTTCGDNGECAPCANCCNGSGACQDGETNAACGSSGTCEVCTGQEECQGQTCACVPDCDGKTCGANGCGGSCGSCTAPQTCGGGGSAGICGCTATSCLAQGKHCGSISDGCWGTLNCGSCPQAGQPCTSNVCGTCVPTCANTCPGESDGCGGTCGGSCPGGWICSGGWCCRASEPVCDVYLGGCFSECLESQPVTP